MVYHADSHIEMPRLRLPESKSATRRLELWQKHSRVKSIVTSLRAMKDYIWCS